MIQARNLNRRDQRKLQNELSSVRKTHEDLEAAVTVAIEVFDSIASKTATVGTDFGMPEISEMAAGASKTMKVAQQCKQKGYYAKLAGENRRLKMMLDNEVELRRGWEKTCREQEGALQDGIEQRDRQILELWNFIRKVRSEFILRLDANDFDHAVSELPRPIFPRDRCRVCGWAIKVQRQGGLRTR